MGKISKDQKEVWKRLNHVPKKDHVVDWDVNSMYSHNMIQMADRILLINKVSGDPENVKTVKVLKSR